MSAFTNAETALCFPADVMAAACPSRQILTHLTSRWSLLVLVALRDGTLRFGELKRRIGGISERMLAQTLGTLEGDGFVARRALEVVPPHVEYSLTPLGREAAERVLGLTGWIEANLGAILGAGAAAGCATAVPDQAAAELPSP